MCSEVTCHKSGFHSIARDKNAGANPEPSLLLPLTKQLAAPFLDRRQVSEVVDEKAAVAPDNTAHRLPFLFCI